MPNAAGIPLTQQERDAIAAAIPERGVSAVARAIGVSSPAIHRIIKDQSNPSKEMLTNLLAHLSLERIVSAKIRTKRK